MEFNIQTVQTGFFQVVFGLVRVISALWQFIRGGAIDVSRANRIIVAQLAVATRDHLEPLLSVNDVFYRGTDIVIIERCDISQHGQGDLLVALGYIYHDARLALEQVSGFGGHVVHCVDLTGAQGILASR